MEIVAAIQEKAREFAPEMVRVRRRLHQCPELSLQEVQTAQVIAEEMRKIPGITVYEHMAEGTGVVAVLQGEAGAGKNVLLRADIDALPVDEPTGLAYRSQNEGKMHACGHDAHAAWVIGSAMILSSLRSKLRGTVKFVFQPGEETGGGAQALVEKDHVLEKPPIDAAFAAHAWPSIPVGKLGIATHCAFGCPGSFFFTIKGQSGHGSWPHLAKNPIMTAARICALLPQIPALKIAATETCLVSVGAIHAGKQGVGNLIPETCEVAGTFRAVKPEVMKVIEQEIEKTIAGECAADGVEYELRLRNNSRPVINNPQYVQYCRDRAAEILGEEEAYLIPEDNLGGENFYWYNERVPGVYLFSGIADGNPAQQPMLHSREFRLDERAIANTAAVFANIVLQINEK